MLKAWGITNCGGRSQNDDAYCLKQNEEYTLAMVCDGVGGAKAGNIASTTAVSMVSEYIGGLDSKTLLANPAEHMIRAVNRANEEIFHKSHEPEFQGMATTMVSAFIQGNKVTILNAGDSRAYRITPGIIAYRTAPGRIVCLTRDHSYVQGLVDLERLTPEQARRHPWKHLITLALGFDRTIAPDLYNVEMRPGEFLLLCSDGLSNSLKDKDFLFEVIEGGEPETCCLRLLKRAMQNGADDNVTAVLIQFS